jgi:hypothetical protein
MSWRRNELKGGLSIIILTIMAYMFPSLKKEKDWWKTCMLNLVIW